MPEIQDSMSAAEPVGGTSGDPWSLLRPRSAYKFLGTGVRLIVRGPAPEFASQGILAGLPRDEENGRHWS